MFRTVTQTFVGRNANCIVESAHDLKIFDRQRTTLYPHALGADCDECKERNLLLPEQTKKRYARLGMVRPMDIASELHRHDLEEW